MSYVTEEQIIQQNGQMSTDEFLIKSLNEPGFLSKRYILPSVQTNVARRAVLGAFLAGNKYIAPAKVMEIMLMPAAESRSGLGMYGDGDINIARQRVTGHQGGTVDILAGQAVEIGKRVEKWSTIGNDKIAFTLNYTMSVTKRFNAVGVAQSDLPQAIQLAIQSILQAFEMAYEDVFMLEFLEMGVNLNEEFLNGDTTRPVCKYVADPTKPVDVHFNAGTDAKNNAYVQLINNIRTYCSEIALDAQWTEMIVSPIFTNDLVNSANWVFNSYANTQQTQEMRTGIIGSIVNGMRLFEAPRMSARYGNVLLNGKKCPDFFLVDRRAVMIPTVIVESLHLIQAPSDFFQTILIKSLEYFGIYPHVRTIEDYQAQKAGKLRSAAISYGYIRTNPNNEYTISSVTSITDGTIKAGLASFSASGAASIVSGSYTDGDTQGVSLVKLSTFATTAGASAETYATKLDSRIGDGIDPSGIRFFISTPAQLTSATAYNGLNISLGVISDFYQESQLTDSTIYVNAWLVASNSDPVKATFKIVKGTKGFANGVVTLL